MLERNRTKGHDVAVQMLTGEAVRAQARSGRWVGPTCGLAPGYLQANLVILPHEAAVDFRRFCQLNPKPCPILDVTEPGDWEPRHVAPGADLRTDLPRYRVYQRGLLLEEPADIVDWWRDDLVTFVLGCSFSFEAAMHRAGLPVRHLDQGCNVPMYRTNIACTPAGVFAGPLVVTMRPLTPAQAITAIVISARYPQAHGAPIHFGPPEAIGIADLQRPDYGDAVMVRPGEVPVFWACGVTPQAVLTDAKLELAITHSPGCMLVTDRLAEDGRAIQWNDGSDERT
jgi:uncharacterized protein YcsI (UPF0317 family)